MRFWEKDHNKTKIPHDWISLTSFNQLEQLITDSEEKTVIIFKHSIRCDLSAYRKSTIVNNWENWGREVDFYYLDLINYREISNAIEERFRVRHESPQLLVIKNGEAVKDVSHHQVDLDLITDSVQSA